MGSLWVRRHAAEGCSSISYRPAHSPSCHEHDPSLVKPRSGLLVNLICERVATPGRAHIELAVGVERSIHRPTHAMGEHLQNPLRRSSGSPSVM